MGSSSFQSTRPCGARRSERTQTETARPHFNPRARVGRDSGMAPMEAIWFIFQSTRPCGARRGARYPHGCLTPISIHAPVWGATHFAVRVSRPIDISIHAPVWGATMQIGDGLAQDAISIHAPVWGATNPRLWALRRILISIHAPVWGATHMEEDDHVHHQISIHAPVWGATMPFEKLAPRCLIWVGERNKCSLCSYSLLPMDKLWDLGVEIQLAASQIDHGLEIFIISEPRARRLMFCMMLFTPSRMAFV